MVRKDEVLEVVQGLELSDGLTTGCIILGLTILAMAVLVAKFPEVEPLSEDGGDDGCDPCVAILLVGGFRSKGSLVVVAPLGREPSLKDMMPTYLLLLLSNVGNGSRNRNGAWVSLSDVTLDAGKKEFHHVIRCVKLGHGLAECVKKSASPLLAGWG